MRKGRWCIFEYILVGNTDKICEIESALKVRTHIGRIQPLRGLLLGLADQCATFM